MNRMMDTGVDYNLTVSKSENGMTVLVMPRINGLKDDARHHLTPLTLRGTPEEIDAGFFAVVSQPVQRAAGLLTGMAQYEKQAALAAANTKAAKERKDKEAKEIRDNKDKESKEAREKKEKYDRYIKKAEEQEADKEYDEAIMSLKQARLHAAPQALGTVDGKIAALRAKSNEGTLFGASAAQPASQSRSEPPFETPAAPQSNASDTAHPAGQRPSTPCDNGGYGQQQGMQFSEELRQAQGYPASTEAPAHSQNDGNSLFRNDRQERQPASADPFENIPSKTNKGTYDATPRNATSDGYQSQQGQQQNPANGGISANGHAMQQEQRQQNPPSDRMSANGHTAPAEQGHRYGTIHPSAEFDPRYGSAYNAPACREDEYSGYVDFPGNNPNQMYNTQNL